jgi:hypothetical protein
MLIKYARTGDQVKEYLLEDNARISDFYDTMGIEPSDEENDDNSLFLTRNGSTSRINWNDEDKSLQEGDFLTIKEIVLSDFESSILAVIEDKEDQTGDAVDNMTSSDRKDLVEKLISRIKKGNWDN